MWILEKVGLSEDVELWYKVFNYKLNGEVGSSHKHTHTHTLSYLVCYAIEYLDDEVHTFNSSITNLPFPKYSLQNLQFRCAFIKTCL